MYILIDDKISNLIGDAKGALLHICFYVVLNLYDCSWPPNVHGTDMLDCHMTFINTFLHYNVKKKKKKLEKFCSETIKFKLYDDD